MNKKALIESRVTKMILFVAGISLLLIFAGKLFLDFNSEQDVCQQSVVLRATMPQVLENFVPLRCKTQKYCVVGSNSGNCKSIYGENVKTVKIKVKTTTELERFLTDQLLSCWIMMGKGKLSLFNQAIAQNYGFDTIYPSCVVCSRIGFDFSSLSKINLENVDVLNFMASYKIKGKDMTYLDYFSDSSGKIGIEEGITLESLAKNMQDYINKTLTSETEKAKEISELDAAVNAAKSEQIKINYEASNEVGIVFMQITAPGHGDTFLKTVGTIVGVEIGGYLKAPTIMNSANKGAWALMKKIGGSVKGGSLLTLTLAIAALDVQQAFVGYNRAVAAGYCGQFSTGDQAREGCSAVRLINYNADSISEVCQNIESY